MGEAFWNHQRSVIGGTQDFPVPEQKGGRASAQIHRDIEHLATQTAHEFCLRVRRVLKVHTSYRAQPSRKGVINLDDAFPRNE
jgi:hypothetical protein